MTAYVFTASRLKISLIPKLGILIKTHRSFYLVSRNMDLKATLKLETQLNLEFD